MTDREATLEQALAMAQETLAARDAEIRELHRQLAKMAAARLPVRVKYDDESLQWQFFCSISKELAEDAIGDDAHASNLIAIVRDNLERAILGRGAPTTPEPAP